MKVDMSPEAVLGRLNTMGQLWELSVALMNSKSLDGVELRSPRWRDSMIHDSIRKVLIDDWDPIGVRGVPGAIDEYDAYIGRFYRILAGSRSKDETVNGLSRIELEEIGVSTSESVRNAVAEKLLCVNILLNSKL
jgi:hypothetical protein